MDDALVHERNEQFHSYGLVLILVVMDDALALRHRPIYEDDFRKS